MQELAYQGHGLRFITKEQSVMEELWPTQDKKTTDFQRLSQLEPEKFKNVLTLVSNN